MYVFLQFYAYGLLYSIANDLQHTFRFLLSADAFRFNKNMTLLFRLYTNIYMIFFLFYFFSSLHLVDVFSFAVALFAFCLYPSCWWCLCEWVSVCVCAYDEHWSTEYIWLLWRKDSSALMLINSRWIWGGFLLLLLLLLRFLRFVVLRCARGLFVVIFCYSRFSTW